MKWRQEFTAQTPVTMRGGNLVFDSVYSPHSFLTEKKVTRRLRFPDKLIKRVGDYIPSRRGSGEFLWAGEVGGDRGFFLQA